MNMFEKFEKISSDAEKEIEKTNIEILLLEEIIQNYRKQILEKSEDYPRLDELKKAFKELEMKKEELERDRDELLKCVILLN